MIAEQTVRLFAHRLTVTALMVGSVLSGGWSAARPSEMAVTLCLSILALALTAAVLYVGEQRQAVADRRDRAMHAKLDELLRGVPAADEDLAGLEDE